MAFQKLGIYEGSSPATEPAAPAEKATDVPTFAEIKTSDMPEIGEKLKNAVPAQKIIDAVVDNNQIEGHFQTLGNITPDRTVENPAEAANIGPAPGNLEYKPFQFQEKSVTERAKDSLNRGAETAKNAYHSIGTMLSSRWISMTMKANDVIDRGAEIVQNAAVTASEKLSDIGEATSKFVQERIEAAKNGAVEFYEDNLTLDGRLKALQEKLGVKENSEQQLNTPENRSKIFALDENERVAGAEILAGTSIFGAFRRYKQRVENIKARAEQGLHSGETIQVTSEEQLRALQDLAQKAGIENVTYKLEAEKPKAEPSPESEAKYSEYISFFKSLDAELGDSKTLPGYLKDERKSLENAIADLQSGKTEAAIAKMQDLIVRNTAEIQTDANKLGPEKRARLVAGNEQLQRFLDKLRSVSAESAPAEPPTQQTIESQPEPVEIPVEQNAEEGTQNIKEEPATPISEANPESSAEKSEKYNEVIEWFKQFDHLSDPGYIAEVYKLSGTDEVEKIKIVKKEIDNVIQALENGNPQPAREKLTKMIKLSMDNINMRSVAGRKPGFEHIHDILDQLKKLDDAENETGKGSRGTEMNDYPMAA